MPSRRTRLQRGPTARPIPGWGIAPAIAARFDRRAESPTHNGPRRWRCARRCVRRGLWIGPLALFDWLSHHSSWPLGPGWYSAGLWPYRAARPTPSDPRPPTSDSRPPTPDPRPPTGQFPYLFICSRLVEYTPGFRCARGASFGGDDTAPQRAPGGQTSPLPNGGNGEKAPSPNGRKR